MYTSSRDVRHFSSQFLGSEHGAANAKDKNVLLFIGYKKCFAGIHAVSVLFLGISVLTCHPIGRAHTLALAALLERDNEYLYSDEFLCNLVWRGAS